MELAAKERAAAEDKIADHLLPGHMEGPVARGVTVNKA